MSGVVLWFTGLSGSGKSTIARVVAQAVREQGRAVEELDGDVIRSVFPATGFSREERDQHVRRVAFLASRLAAHGVDVIVSLISPYRDGRTFARDLADRFVEVHVATTLEVCEQRDVKGLYARARSGEIASFTGVSDPYEEPLEPELRIDTELVSLPDGAQLVLAALERVRGDA